MAKRAKRWRLSDVALAMGFHPVDAATVGEDARAMGVGEALRLWNVSFPEAEGFTTDQWDAMTSERREAVVVAAARRLKVPRRG